MSKYIWISMLERLIKTRRREFSRTSLSLPPLFQVYKSTL